MTDIVDRPVTVPVETVTPIKPSEALRLGRLIHPAKCTGHWFNGQGAACALGAIHVGWGGSADDLASNGFPRDFQTTISRFRDLGLDDPDGSVGFLFDDFQDAYAGDAGDVAALAYLESRGL